MHLGVITAQRSYTVGDCIKFSARTHHGLHRVGLRISAFREAVCMVVSHFA